MRLARLLPWLREYPNKAMAQLLIVVFLYGFYVPEFEGLGGAWVKNLKSANLKKEVFFDKIMKEVNEGQVEGAFSCPTFENFRLSPLGLVPIKETFFFLFDTQFVVF